MGYIIDFFVAYVDMFVDMAMYIMIGLLVAGILNVYVKRARIYALLGKKSFGSVIKASVIGVPLPLCSCGVVPTAIELKKGGASNGAVVSFLISTPQTGIDSIIGNLFNDGASYGDFPSDCSIFLWNLRWACVQCFLLKKMRLMPVKLKLIHAAVVVKARIVLA